VGDRRHGGATGPGTVINIHHFNCQCVIFQHAFSISRASIFYGTQKSLLRCYCSRANIMPTNNQIAYHQGVITSIVVMELSPPKVLRGKSLLFWGLDFRTLCLLQQVQYATRFDPDGSYNTRSRHNKTTDTWHMHSNRTVITMHEVSTT
jgi:hypothetical protein